MSIELKVVIVGSMATGKTSITQRFASGEFLETTQTTIGAAFINRQLIRNNYNISLQLWDTAGQERLRSILGLYYRKAHAVLLCYDVNEGCDDLPGWLNDIAQNCPPEILLTVAANKSDLLEQQYAGNLPAAQRVINDALQQAKEIVEYEGFEAEVFATSAKSGAGITEVFVHIVDRLLEKYQQELQTMNNNNNTNVVDIDNDQTQTKPGCC